MFNLQMEYGGHKITGILVPGTSLHASDYYSEYPLYRVVQRRYHTPTLTVELMICWAYYPS